jgi:hypothetical protein
MTTTIELHSNDDAIDPDGMASDSERLKYYELLTDKVSASYPDADVRLLLHQQSQRGYAVRPDDEALLEEITRDVRFIAEAAWEEWMATL